MPSDTTNSSEVTTPAASAESLGEPKPDPVSQPLQGESALPGDSTPSEMPPEPTPAAAEGSSEAKQEALTPNPPPDVAEGSSEPKPDSLSSTPSR